MRAIETCGKIRRKRKIPKKMEIFFGNALKSMELCKLLDLYLFIFKYRGYFKRVAYKQNLGVAVPFNVIIKLI